MTQIKLINFSEWKKIEDTFSASKIEVLHEKGSYFHMWHLMRETEYILRTVYKADIKKLLISFTGRYEYEIDSQGISLVRTGDNIAEAFYHCILDFIGRNFVE